MTYKERFKKWLPKRHELQQHNSLRCFGPGLFNPQLWHLNRCSVAKGVAAGLLVAFIPLPIQMLSATLIAILLQGNIPIAIAITWISNPFTFLPITFFIYKIGQYITHDPTTYQLVQEFQWQGQSWKEISVQCLAWAQSLGKPFLVGLPIFSISAAILGYFLVHLIWYAIVSWHSKKTRKQS